MSRGRRPSRQHISTEDAAFLHVKKRTRRLYARFERERAALLTSVSGVGEQEERERAASRVLRSLLFVSLLQWKGLLGTQGRGVGDGERDYLLRRLERVRQQYGPGHFQRFYAALLNSLSGQKARRDGRNHSRQ